MAIHIMSGVQFDVFTPQAMLGLQVADECCAEQSCDCLVTSAYREGDWETTLLHGRGYAFDIAVRDLRGNPLAQDVVDKIVVAITARIGKPSGGQFDVLYEGDKSASAGWTGKHIHIEYDPASGSSHPPKV
jgi:D-alanyl-D-alanine dipeptidase